jgi:hypothetical protein
MVGHKVVDTPKKVSNTQEVNYRTNGEHDNRRRRDRCNNLSSERRCTSLWHDVFTSKG